MMSNEVLRESFDVAFVDFPDPSTFALGKLYSLHFVPPTRSPDTQRVEANHFVNQALVRYFDEDWHRALR